MEELLKLWAELAPDECEYYDVVEMWVADKKPHDDGGHVFFELGNKENGFIDGMIKWSTMQAIEARGWRWGRDPISGTYQIVIPKKGFTTDYWEWIEGYENLLEAYLKALEEVE